MDAEIQKDETLMRFLGTNLSLGSSPCHFFEAYVTLCATTPARTSLEDLTRSLHQQNNLLLWTFALSFFAKSGKILSVSPLGGTGKCWGRDPGSLDHRVVPAGHQDWPRAKARSCSLLLD